MILKNKKLLSNALIQIEKQFGKGAIIDMGKKYFEKDIETISTGSIGLDIALGIGGFPKGRIIEIYGPESSGKTTLALETISESQKLGGIAVFIDAEHALDYRYTKKLGVNIEKLLISQPDTGEEALEITDILIQSNSIDIIVIDSVAALVPKAEMEGNMGDSHIGLQARLMSQALRKLTSNLRKSKTLLIFINQIRTKIGTIFGNPEVTTGGNALKFYASIRLDIRRISSIKKGDQIIGNEIRAKVVKNKLAPPFKQVEFDIMYGEGISNYSEILNLGVKEGIIKKSGIWYTYIENNLGKGKENAKNFLKNNPDIFQKIYISLQNQYTKLKK